MSAKQRTKGDVIGSVDLRRIIFGTIAGIVVCLILLFAASWFVDHEKLSLEDAHWISAVIAAASAFCAGYIAVRHNQKKLLCGLLAANFAWLLLLICGMLLFSSPMASERLAMNTVAVQLGAFGSAVLSGLRE